MNLNNQYSLFFVMDREMNFQKIPNLSVEIKQTSKGTFYLGSLKINAETTEELDNLIESSINKITQKLNKFNVEDTRIKKTSEILLNDDEEQLFTKLREIRMDMAKRENYPPYIIFHDVVLKQFAKLKPTTKEEMLKINGVGERRFAKYGELFLGAIRNFSNY